MAALHSLYPRDLLTTAQAAARAGVQPVTIRQWQNRGLLIPAIRADRYNRANLYARQDIDAAVRTLAERAAIRAADAA